MSAVSSVKAISSVTGSLLGLAVVGVALRFYARKQVKVPLLSDDWLILGALMFFTGLAACIFSLVHIKAAGYSSYELSKAYQLSIFDEAVAIKTSLNCLTVATLASSKASALFFYRRIFCVTPHNIRARTFNGVVTASIVITACWFIAFELLTIFQCRGRFKGFADPHVYAKYCTISWGFLLGFAISDVLLDILVMVLPIPQILQLHINLRRKLSLLGIFMLACVAFGASIARLVVYLQLYTQGVVYYDTHDSQRTNTRLLFFYVLECGFSIIAINLPSLWPLFTGGRALESVMRMARSVTSLASSRSDSSGSKQQSTERTMSHDVNTVDPASKTGHAIELRSLSEPRESSPSRPAEIEYDSVGKSSHGERPRDVERGWKDAINNT